MRCLITINRTNISIEIDGRPRSRAPCAHACAIGNNNNDPTAPDPACEIVRQLAHLDRQHLVPQALHLPAHERQHHTSTRSENHHEQANPLKRTDGTSLLTDPDATLTATRYRRSQMPGPGRNQPCPCGSGRKTKRCCGEQRGPSEDQLARAHLATLAHDAVHDLAHLSDEALEILWEGLFDLPTIDLSCTSSCPS